MVHLFLRLTFYTFRIITFLKGFYVVVAERSARISARLLPPSWAIHTGHRVTQLSSVSTHQLLHKFGSFLILVAIVGAW